MLLLPVPHVTVRLPFSEYATVLVPVEVRVL